MLESGSHFENGGHVESGDTFFILDLVTSYHKIIKPRNANIMCFVSIYELSIAFSRLLAAILKRTKWPLKEICHGGSHMLQYFESSSVKTYYHSNIQ